MNNAIYVVEGPDCSGKTTICNMVKDKLMVHGIDALVFRQPGGTGVGELARSIVKNNSMNPESQALAFLLSFSELWEHLEKNVNNKVVLLDRWYHSTLAYQFHSFDYKSIELLSYVQRQASDRAAMTTFIIQTPFDILNDRLCKKNGMDAIEKSIVEQTQRQLKIVEWYNDFARRPHYGKRFGEPVVTVENTIGQPELAAEIIKDYIIKHEKSDEDNNV